MQTNTQTSGPWKAYLYGKDAQGRTIATVGANDGNNRICEISPYDLPLTDVAANAHLIAAAPDLLAALITCIPLLEASHLDMMDAEQMDSAKVVLQGLEQVREAIAKAKGGA